MRLNLSFHHPVSPWIYAICAPLLLASQHLLVVLAYRAAGIPLIRDAEFWLLPLRRLSHVPDITPLSASLLFAFTLAVTWGLALLSFRRAWWSRAGFPLAALSVVPVLQIGAVAILMLMPVRSRDSEPEPEPGVDLAHVLQGVLVGAAIIVAAVLISAVTFGAYGWGLFVMTPFLAGAITGYLANRRVAMDFRQTLGAVVTAGLLGTLALLMFALEGLMCILLVAPMAAVAAILGGAAGRAAALARNKRGNPLMSVAVLPILFALEAAMPPSVPIEAHETIDVAAPPAAVWNALTSGDPILVRPGLVGIAGLAYPIRGRIDGAGVGAERIGEFSTGTARERITQWLPERRLAFAVLTQPPAMEEMSPYRRVHAPHLLGYFDTSWTSFDLQPLPGGGTRLTARAAHTLRIDPALYWQPIARWAVGQNVSRVLRDIKAKAEGAMARRAAGPDPAPPQQ